MSDHKEPNYMAIFYLLAALTALEIGVVFVPIAKLITAIALIGMALVKAALVALYFMHLKYEKRTLGIIALTPLILCTLLIVSLLPDLTGTPHASESKESSQIENVEQVADASDSASE